MIDLPKLAPVPKKYNAGRRHKPVEAGHIAADGNICIYVIGVKGSGVSKIGVSTKPYFRMGQLARQEKREMMMCYFVEVPREAGFEVEAAIKHLCLKEGLQVRGEWIKFPRDRLTGFIRDLMADNGIDPTHEVGDTGDHRDTVIDDAFIPCRLAQPVGPRRRFGSRSIGKSS